MIASSHPLRAIRLYSAVTGAALPLLCASTAGSFFGKVTVLRCNPSTQPQSSSPLGSPPALQDRQVSSAFVDGRGKLRAKVLVTRSVGRRAAAARRRQTPGSSEVWRCGLKGPEEDKYW